MIYYDEKFEKDKIEEEKSPAPSGIRTLDLMIMLQLRPKLNVTENLFPEYFFAIV